MLREDPQQAGGVNTAGDDSVWRCAACGADVARDRDRISLDGQQTRAFVNPDGKVVVVVMNPTSKAGEYNVVVGATSVQISSRPHSIQTVVF